MAVPGAMPVTIPVVPIVATALLLLLHEPPDNALPNVVVPPTHTFAVPVIVPAPVVVATVTFIVAVAVPQVFVTV